MFSLVITYGIVAFQLYQAGNNRRGSAHCCNEVLDQLVKARGREDLIECLSGLLNDNILQQEDQTIKGTRDCY